MDANKIIDDMGGTNAVARLCEITPSSVSDWRKGGIPKPWLKYFGVIRPDLFGIKKSKSKKAA